MAYTASLVTVNVDELANQTGNVYEAITIISKRSKQISIQMKEELTSKLAEFATNVDNLEEIFENREQIEISRYYERQPKAPVNAYNEYISGETYFSKKDAEF